MITPIRVPQSVLTRLLLIIEYINGLHTNLSRQLLHYGESPAATSAGSNVAGPPGCVRVSSVDVESIARFGFALVQDLFDNVLLPAGVKHSLELPFGCLSPSACVPGR